MSRYNSCHLTSAYSHPVQPAAPLVYKTHSTHTPTPPATATKHIAQFSPPCAAPPRPRGSSRPPRPWPRRPPPRRCARVSCRPGRPWAGTRGRRARRAACRCTRSTRPGSPSPSRRGCRSPTMTSCLWGRRETVTYSAYGVLKGGVGAGSLGVSVSGGLPQVLQVAGLHIVAVCGISWCWENGSWGFAEEFLARGW